LLAELDSGRDMVVGWKRQRQDALHKTLPSRVFNALVGLLTGVRLHDHNSGFKAMRTEVAKNLALYGDRHRFLPVLAQALGFKVGEIPVHHRARKYGASKYGFGRFLRGFVDLVATVFLCRYRSRPMHFFGTVGLLALAVAAITGIASFAWPSVAPWAWFAGWLAPTALGFGLTAELALERAGGPAVPYSIAEDTNG
jgi:dolichol-phosphate mannosyltransferase